MTRSLVERRLSEVAVRLRELRSELAVTEEQLRHLAEEADDARLRALVSEDCPLRSRAMKISFRSARCLRARTMCHNHKYLMH